MTDPSALSVILGVLAFAALTLALLIPIRAYRNAPTMPADTSRLDTLDGIGLTTCHMRCSLPGTITRVTRADLGMEVVRVCPGHSDEGDRVDRMWWAA